MASNSHPHEAPLARVLDVARRTGWDAVELRRVDFDRAATAGQSADEVLALVRASGLPVACVGVRHGWMFAEGAEYTERLRTFGDSCRWARSLGCATVMSPVDFASGPVAQAAARLREVGDIAREHGVRLALRLPLLRGAERSGLAPRPRGGRPGSPRSHARAAPTLTLTLSLPWEGEGTAQDGGPGAS
ncbi:MAG: TIM barrel protein [Candidatus Rokubacteria bacterium]|nr:TIM barrel protein [Candidatus Rokubacteria bacterium]